MDLSKLLLIQIGIEYVIIGLYQYWFKDNMGAFIMYTAYGLANYGALLMLPK